MQICTSPTRKSEVGDEKTTKNHWRCAKNEGKSPWRCAKMKWNTTRMKERLEVHWNGREKSENGMSEG